MNDVTEETPHSLRKPNSESISSKRSILAKSSTKIDEIKLHEKPFRPSNRHTVPEVPKNLHPVASYPKREPVSHPIRHKEFHKLGSANNAKERNFNAFDMVVIDIPASYSPLRWEEPTLNTFASPDFHYVPMKHLPSIFDFFLGLNSISGNFVTDPKEIQNDIYSRQIFENPSWNHRLSFDKLVSPARVQQNGNRFVRDVNPIQLLSKFSKPINNCTCACGCVGKK